MNDIEFKMNTSRELGEIKAKLESMEKALITKQCSSPSKERVDTNRKLIYILLTFDLGLLATVIIAVLQGV